MSNVKCEIAGDGAIFQFGKYFLAKSQRYFSKEIENPYIQGSSECHKFSSILSFVISSLLS
jgi:hypothetical protein